MTLSRWSILALFVSTLALAAATDAPVPVSTNKDDAPPRTKTGKVFASTDADLPPALGPSGAKVLVIVFSDFQCPVCRRSADATQQIAEEFPGDVRVEFWQHPLTMHQNAENAAVASLAAERQGKFWEYHDEVFRNQSAIDAASLEGYASQLGLDVEKFKADYAAPELRERAKAEGAVAEQFGAHSTPSFMVNGKLKMGWGSWYAFRADVEHELAEANKLEAQGTPVAKLAEARAQSQFTDAGLFEVYRAQVLHVAPDPPPPEPKPEKHKKKSKKA
jgi:protein-disulfide isomerase